MYEVLRTVLAPQDVLMYRSNVLEDEDVIGSSDTDERGVGFSLFFTVNRGSGTHSNIFLVVLLPENICRNVCDSNGLEKGSSIYIGTTDKKVVVNFRDFAADRDFGTYHRLFLGVKLPSNS